MKKYLCLFLIAIATLSCNQKSKIEKAVEEITVETKLYRFEQAFFNAKPSNLPNVKAEYPFFFPQQTPDNVWIEKMQNSQWRALYQEVEKKYANFNTQQEAIEQIFKHFKYYFPATKNPEIYTVIAEMDYNNKVIYAQNKLIIALELFLGKQHEFYADFPEYITQNFEERQLLPEVASSLALSKTTPSLDKTLLSQMIYYGKLLYLKDVLLPEDYTDAEKIGYTPEQIKWSQENESYIWTFFINEKLLYNTDSRLPNRFINLAPFSKFYLEIDNESPGRIGQWIGWQIVRSFMENNAVSVPQMLQTEANELFVKSKYKPKK